MIKYLLWKIAYIKWRWSKWRLDRMLRQARKVSDKHNLGFEKYTDEQLMMGFECLVISKKLGMSYEQYAELLAGQDCGYKTTEN